MVADPETISVPPPSQAEYRKLQELASGGMGSVELARAVSGPRAGEIVAVKRLHPHLEREKHFADMFFDEAWITAGLNHPNVVEIFDWGQDSNGRYLALEFVPGDSLLALIRDAKKNGVFIPIDIALYIIGKTAEGLHAAHELRNGEGELRHLVHRDVTPSNVLIGINGEVKLIDFGVAKARDRLSHTSTGTIKGKFGYMSPEQARGFPIDRRSDVFSLGVVLWETLALRRLYRSDSELEILRMIVEDPPTPINTVREDAPEALENLIAGSLAKNRDDRLGSCAEFAEFIWAVFHEEGYTVTESDIASFFVKVMPERAKACVELMSGANEFIEPTVSRPGSGSFSGPQNVSGAVPRPPRVTGEARYQTSGSRVSMPGVAVPATNSALANTAFGVAHTGNIPASNTGRNASQALPLPLLLPDQNSDAQSLLASTYTALEPVPQRSSRSTLFGALAGGGLVALLGAAALFMMNRGTSLSPASQPAPVSSVATSTAPVAPTVVAPAPTAPAIVPRPVVAGATGTASETASEHSQGGRRGSRGRGGGSNAQPANGLTVEQTRNAMLNPQPNPAPSGNAAAGRTETPRTETPRAETPRAETTRTETPRSETPRSETPRTGGSTAQPANNGTPSNSTNNANRPGARGMFNQTW